MILEFGIRNLELAVRSKFPEVLDCQAYIG
jgi:hypothetical protein